VTSVRTEIIIKATRTQDVLGEKGQRIRELTSVVQKRSVVRVLFSGLLRDIIFNSLFLLLF
jgi:ribosomal protein S3